MADETTQEPAIPFTPEQVASVTARLRTIAAYMNDAVAIITALELHGLAGAVGELRAAFSALAALHPSS